jgi:hypothetical protein
VGHRGYGVSRMGYRGYRAGYIRAGYGHTGYGGAHRAGFARVRHVRGAYRAHARMR